MAAIIAIMPTLGNLMGGLAVQRLCQVCFITAIREQKALIDEFESKGLGVPP